MQICCQYIAHAGGKIKNTKYSNSLEALNNSKRLGYQFIEIDISVTNDNKLVLIHDWYKTRKKLQSKAGIISEKTFLKNKMVNDLTPINLGNALDWLKNNPHIYFISDTKNIDIISVLKYVNEFYPQIKERFIPQIYFFDEYKKVKELGYNNIILILYKLKSTNDQIIEFVKNHKFLAISLSKKEAKTNLRNKLQAIGQKILVYTVNKTSEIKYFRQLGIETFFTDNL